MINLFTKHNTTHTKILCISALAGLPVIQTDPMIQIVKVNEKVKFECFVSGSNSTLTVTWERNRKNYTSGNINNMIHSNGVNSSLTIEEARVIKHSGKYRCKATNADGRSVVSNEAELISK